VYLTGTIWLDEEFEVLESIIKAREKAGLTQEQLAKRIGTKQPALSVIFLDTSPF
jgi:ribosome-binding protein aMBF1 (putative translation factor)